MSEVLTISCDTCAVRRTACCDDCVVTFVLREGGEGGEGGAVVLDLAEVRAVRLLAAAGLVPTLQHREAI